MRTVHIVAYQTHYFPFENETNPIHTGKVWKRKMVKNYGEKDRTTFVKRALHIGSMVKEGVKVVCREIYLFDE